MSLPVEPAELAGRLARDAHGRPLGEVETVFADEEGTSSRFVGIDTQHGVVVVPVDGAELDPTVYALDLPYAVDRISGAPVVAPDLEELDPETERRVLAHFGTEQPTKLGLVPEPAPAPEPEPEPATLIAEPAPVDDELLLSEEQVVVETERVPAQRVRLRKEIVEEEVTISVVLRHEELIIEREAIGPGEALVEAADGPQAGEPPIEIVLWAEEPVVTTRSVPTERVRVHRTVGTQDHEITTELRRERATVDNPTGEPET